MIEETNCDRQRFHPNDDTAPSDKHRYCLGIKDVPSDGWIIEAACCTSSREWEVLLVEFGTVLQGAMAATG